MFFRDYKSKVVKGIDEDDLLEGMRLPENLSFYGEYSTYVSIAPNGNIFLASFRHSKIVLSGKLHLSQGFSIPVTYKSTEC